MPIKDQTACYRTVNGVKWPNFCDMLDDVHFEDVAKAKAAGARIKKIKHPDGYHQAFIHPDDINKHVE